MKKITILAVLAAIFMSCEKEESKPEFVPDGYFHPSKCLVLDMQYKQEAIKPDTGVFKKFPDYVLEFDTVTYNVIDIDKYQKLVVKRVPYYNKYIARLYYKTHKIGE